MAKKKKTLSDMVKAPRTIDIKGQKHMLAWITPSEGKTLKALGGSGTPGPMGLPAFFFGDPGESPEAYGLESFTPSEPTQVDVADFIGSGDEDDDQSQQQDQALANILSQKNEEDRNWVENKFIEDVKEGKTIGMYQYDPSRGRMSGYTHSTNPLGLGGVLASLLGGGEPMTYTGFGTNPFAPPVQDDGERAATSGPAAPSAPDEPAAPAEMTQAEKDFYGKGIGTATSLPGSEQEIYSKIIAEGTSPLGGRFDREKGLLYLPDGRVIDIKTGREVKTMSGLDIFKPVSTVGV
jgi:hypothetical protein